MTVGSKHHKWTQRDIEMYCAIHVNGYKKVVQAVEVLRANGFTEYNYEELPSYLKGGDNT